MLEEILLLVFVALGGAMATLVLRNRFLQRQTQLHRSSLAPKQLETIKSEIQTLEFERSILSHSIVSAYEFVQGNEVGPDCHLLVTKYKSQLDSINEKIGELQLSVEFTELSEVRNKLASLVQSKISSLDARIGELSRKYGLSTDHLAEQQGREFVAQSEEKNTHPNLVEAKGDVGRVAGVAGATQNKPDDAAVKEVQEEILQALNRLENAGTDYELLTESNRLELEDSKGRDILTSYPLKPLANQNKDNNNVPDSPTNMGRDAVSSVIKYKPS